MEPKLKIVRTIADPPSAREALADAIERRRGAIAARDANQSAHDKIQRRIWDLSESIERADAALEDIKQGYAAHLSRVALGSDEPVPPTPKQAREAMVTVTDERDVLYMSRDSLADAGKGLENDIRGAEWRVAERINDVLREDSIVIATLAKYQQARETCIVLSHALAALPLDVLPRNYDAIGAEWQTRGYAEGERWKAVVKALSTDATAKLPEVQ